MNLLTFDIEDWYHINYPLVDFKVFDRKEDHRALFDKTKQLAAFCKAGGIRGTFFVLGRLLEKKPELGEWIVEQGQELALHGYEHDLLTGKSPDQFKQELDRSLKAFRQITGTIPLGFRAPSWSINEKNLWILEVLDSFGFTYDSSIFPIRNFLYGFPPAPSEPFYPILREQPLRILEIPVPVLNLGPSRIAYSGGIFFNLWPYPVIRKIVHRQTRKGKASLFYFHPWDLWKRSPEQARQLKARWIHLHLGDTLKKFLTLLNTFPLGGISGRLDALKQQADPVRIGGPFGES